MIKTTRVQIRAFFAGFRFFAGKAHKMAVFPIAKNEFFNIHSKKFSNIVDCFLSSMLFQHRKKKNECKFY